MPRVKPKADATPQRGKRAEMNGASTDILTLSEAAAYLRLPEPEMIRMVREQGLPARQVGNEWRFFRTAIHAWLSHPLPKYGKEAQLAVAGAWEDDPYVEHELQEIYKRRGRPMTEDEP